MRHTKLSALDALSEKRIGTVDDKVILITRQPGIKTWGKIDYLKRVHKYRVVQEKPTWRI